MNIRGWGVVEVIAALAATTAVVWILEDGLGFEHASALYLLGVAVIAIRQGTTAALLTALGAFVIYNLLFVEPRFTLAVSRPEELITLFLLLFVGIVIGRLGGAQRERERLAAQREREARALFAISRELATTPRLTNAIGTVLDRLRADAGMTRAWVGVGSTIAGERPFGDTGGPPLEAVGTHTVLRRDRPEDSATWVRIHTGSSSRSGRVVDGVPIPRCARRRPRGDRLTLVGAGVKRRSTDPGGDPAPGGDRRPGGPGASSRPARRGRGGCRDRAPERRAAVGAPRLGVARPAHPPGDDSRRGRQPGRSRDRSG